MKKKKTKENYWSSDTKFDDTVLDYYAEKYMKGQSENDTYWPSTFESYLIYHNVYNTTLAYYRMNGNRTK